MNPLTLDAPSTGRDTVSILIVDDEPGNRETLADIFEEMGYRVESAGTGRQALDILQDRFFNVAILDIKLPDMYGTELLARLKEVHPDTTCIMVTGYASLQTSMKAINAGAYAYILKPLDIEHVCRILQQAIEQQRLLFENQRLLRRLTALSEVTDTALSILNLDVLLHTLLRRIIGAMQADGGAILLLDETTQRLEARATEGIAEGHEIPFSVALGEGFAGRVALQDGPMMVEDTQTDDRLVNPYIRARGVRSLLGAPLRAKDCLIGVVHVDTLRPHDFPSEEIELFNALATRAALLIDNARLYEQEQRMHRAAEAMAEDQRRIAEEVSTLYSVAQALVESMGLDERLEKLAGHLVEVMDVDRCVIWLVERDALVPRTLLGVCSEEEHERWRHVRIEREQFGPSLRAALEQGGITVVPDAQSNGLVEGDLPARFDMRSVLLLPMVLSGEAIGMAWLDQPGRRAQFTDDQLHLGRAIAAQAAVAIQNAQTFEQERTVARTLQESLLPRTKVDDIPSLEINHTYQPASSAAQVGGDYYDFIELPDKKLGVVMGDVCGKGVTAAVYTAMAKYMLHAYAVEDPSPASVISRLNRALYSQMSEDCMFITMVYGVLDKQTGEFTYVNAAHPHPLIYHPERDEVSELATTGGMVGALPNMEFEEKQTRLEPGAVLLLYTDGVTEARTGQEMLETQGVVEVLRKTARGSARSIWEAVFHRALEFSDGNLKDDVAIVAIKARPSSAER
jgi:serine phosphatase RsbU (regulator of sigma subunit)/CheY-like chemotaxis protein